MATQIWLRAETKPNEARAPLTPKEAVRLIQAGFQLTVEKSSRRIFPDSAYAEVGCKIAPEGSWRQAPQEAFILGLKELPEEGSPLPHRHIYFGHAYKNQQGWRPLLTRFVQGGGALYDLEYLVDDQGRRVAAFGSWAGFAGCAVGLDLWCHRQAHGSEAAYGPLHPFSDMKSMVDSVHKNLEVGHKKSPRVLIIGALGRCGQGAVEFAGKVGLEVTGWDLKETAPGGPFPAILDYDLLINTVFVQQPIPPFLTREMVAGPRRLSVIADVSCDPTSPYNPLPLYDQITTFDQPALRVVAKPPLDLIAIDHLPSLLPRESSESFAAMLLPHLIDLDRGSAVWERVRKLFYDKTKPLQKESP